MAGGAFRGSTYLYRQALLQLIHNVGRRGENYLLMLWNSGI